MPEYDLEIQNINETLEKQTTIHERIAMWISQRIGVMYFVYILVALITLWITINMALSLSGHTPFDKPFGFPVLLMISNSIQLLIPMFILVSQNIQEKRAKALADQEYRVAKRTENEAKQIFQYLREMTGKLDVVLNKIKLNQQEILYIEEQQNKFSNSISGTLTSLLQSLTTAMNHRPCLLKQIDDTEVLEAVIKALEDKKQELNDNPHVDQ